MASSSAPRTGELGEPCSNYKAEAAEQRRNEARLRNLTYAAPLYMDLKRSTVTVDADGEEGDADGEGEEESEEEEKAGVSIPAKVRSSGLTSVWTGTKDGRSARLAETWV